MNYFIATESVLTRKVHTTQKPLLYPSNVDQWTIFNQFHAAH